MVFVMIDNIIFKFINPISIKDKNLQEARLFSVVKNHV